MLCPVLLWPCSLSDHGVMSGQVPGTGYSGCREGPHRHCVVTMASKLTGLLPAR